MSTLWVPTIRSWTLILPTPTSNAKSQITSWESVAGGLREDIVVADLDEQPSQQHVPLGHAGGQRSKDLEIIVLRHGKRWLRYGRYGPHGPDGWS